MMFLLAGQGTAGSKKKAAIQCRFIRLQKSMEFTSESISLDCPIIINLYIGVKILQAQIMLLGVVNCARIESMGI